MAHGHNKGEKDKKIRVDVGRLEGIEPPMIASEGLMAAHQQRSHHAPHRGYSSLWVVAERLM